MSATGWGIGMSESDGADVGTRDAGTRDSGAPETGARGTGVPGASAPDAGTPARPHGCTSSSKGAG